MALTAVYFKHGGTGFYQPEKRKGGGNPPVPERRGLDVVRCTSDQFAFLSGCLIRREQARESIAQKSRRARHLLVGVSVLFLTLYISAPGMTFTVSLLGVEQTLTLLHFGAAAPLFIAYLVTYATYLSMRRVKILHECQFIDAELRKFGLPTSHTLIGGYNHACRADTSAQTSYARLAYDAVFRAHDLVLAVLVMLSFVGSVAIAFQAYAEGALVGPHSTVGLFSALFLSIISASVCVPAYWIARIKKGRHATAYLQTLQVQEPLTEAAA